MRICAAAASWVLLVLLSAPAVAQEDLDTEVKDMTWVGFQLLRDASRVFVKTTDPVKYRIDVSRPHLVILTLDNTKVPLFNNTRPLNTKYFDSPITSVNVKIIEAVSPSVRIEIHTRPIHAKFEEVKNDTQLALDFAKQ